MHNNYIYCLIGIAQEAERLENGFKGGNYSGDGQFILGDKCDRDTCPWVDLPTYPQWMLNLVPSLGSSCCLSHEEALLICRTEATTSDCLNGWFYTENA